MQMHIVRNIFTASLLALFGLAAAAVGFLFYFSPVYQLNELTWQLQLQPQDRQIQDQWLQAWNVWQEWRWVQLGQTGRKSNESKITSALAEYSRQFQEYNRSYVVDLVSMEVETDFIAQRPIPFVQETVLDPHFAKGHSYYRVKGEVGEEDYREMEIRLNGNDLAGWRIDESVAVLEPPRTQLVAVGGRELAAVQADVVGLFSQLPPALASSHIEKVTPLISSDAEKAIADYQIIYDAAYRLTSAQPEQIQIAVDLADTDWVTSGVLILQQSEQPDCEPVSLSIAYHRLEQRWAIANLSVGLRALCARDLPGVGTFGGRPVYQLTCADCSLAPVGRFYTLPSTYIPSVVPTGLPGGGSLVPEAALALQKMFVEAQSLGYSPTIVSSYRSYTDQLNTFEFYVATEQARGFDRATAEVRAATIAARPGQSEHQLGTAVDVGPSQIYPYYANNAHRFGFLLSFTAPASTKTGIIYEPWHLRYVGVEIATAVYEAGYLTDGNVYLEAYLQELGGY